MEEQAAKVRIFEFSSIKKASNW